MNADNPNNVQELSEKELSSPGICQEVSVSKLFRFKTLRRGASAPMSLL